MPSKTFTHPELPSGWIFLRNQDKDHIGDLKLKEYKLGTCCYDLDGNKINVLNYVPVFVPEYVFKDFQEKAINRKISCVFKKDPQDNKPP